jgi:hypothetical protein
MITTTDLGQAPLEVERADEDDTTLWFSVVTKWCPDCVGQMPVMGRLAA